MSELKALWIPTRSGNSLHCYLKSEADKVIVHHKYKRCLAMAMWCEFYADSLRVKRNQCRYDEAELAETYYIRCRRYRRWCKVWMELAERFKESK